MNHNDNSLLNEHIRENMDEAKEVTITIKDENSTYKQKFLTYQEFEMSSHDTTIKQFIDESLSNSKIKPEQIIVRSLLVVK